MLIGKAITLVESKNFNDTYLAAELLDACLKSTKAFQSRRIGITGVPGVGKSTFINTLASSYALQNKRTAVLTIDPTSKHSSGSILGDKTRMQDIIADPHIFVRPSPAGDTLGGISATTEQVITIFEAAGYEHIIVETVGVGQSETAVADLTDVFVLLMLPSAGDELQGIKRGIMEMADILFINKSDINEQHAKVAAAHYKNALHLFPPTLSGWMPQVFFGTALQQASISPILSALDKYFDFILATGYIIENRSQQKERQVMKQIEALVRKKYHFEQKDSFQKILKEVQENNMSTLSAALQISNF